MKPSPERIFVVDDDASFRKSLSRLFRTHGFEIETFDSAENFLKIDLANRSGCIVLDVQMPGLSGLDVQEALAKAECTMPIIFLSGRGDIPMSVRAMKTGAVDFLTKPVDEEALLKAIRSAMEENRRYEGERARIEEARSRIRTLTEREYEVMRHVIAGKLNKQIAGDLGVVEKTVKVHRARAMEKTGVRSVAELVRLCTLAEVEPAQIAE